MGVTVTVAASDNGASDGVQDGQLHVDFPASSPYVVACGGTTLTASGGAISSKRSQEEAPTPGPRFAWEACWRWASRRYLGPQEPRC
jgi:kumamolisin